MIVGIGVDEVEVERFQRSLERTPTMVERLFTEGERAYAARAEPATAAQRLAARFAAKEAVLKSLGAGLGACGFHDIEVVRDEESGVPSVVLRGPAVELAATKGATVLHLSLTHTATMATAFVVAERRS
jgi:holo-[acyl-carrier protein] synthase